MIGIIAAMEVEKDAIVEKMSDLQKREYLNQTYYVGKLSGKDVVVVVCGVGKVSSAIVTGMLIERFKPELVINVGCAGGAKEFENTLDIVIADRLTYHDWNNMVINNKPNSFDDNQYSFKVDDDLVEIARNVCHRMPEINTYVGGVVSGDTFVTLDEDVERITAAYPQAYACDMESCSVAHACSYYGVRYVIIRSLSDIVVRKNNDLDFYQFAKAASVHSATFTELFLEQYEA